MSGSVLISLLVTLNPGTAAGNPVNVTFAPSGSSVNQNVPPLFSSVPSGSSVNQNVPLPANYTVFPDIGVALKFYPNRVTWNTARKRCVSEGASLAIVDSFKKNGYIMALENNPFGSHTGIHRLYDGIEWISSRNDQPLAFIPWKPDANINAGTGDCVALWNDGSGVGPWNCKNVLPSVCEIPLSTGRDNDSKISRLSINPRFSN